MRSNTNSRASARRASPVSTSARSNSQSSPRYAQSTIAFSSRSTFSPGTPTSTIKAGNVGNFVGANKASVSIVKNNNPNGSSLRARESNLASNPYNDNNANDLKLNLDNVKKSSSSSIFKKGVSKLPLFTQIFNDPTDSIPLPNSKSQVPSKVEKENLSASPVANTYTAPGLTPISKNCKEDIYDKVYSIDPEIMGSSSMDYTNGRPFSYYCGDSYYRGDGEESVFTPPSPTLNKAVVDDVYNSVFATLSNYDFHNSLSQTQLDDLVAKTINESYMAIENKENKNIDGPTPTIQSNYQSPVFKKDSLRVIPQANNYPILDSSVYQNDEDDDSHESQSYDEDLEASALFESKNVNSTSLRLLGEIISNNEKIMKGLDQLNAKLQQTDTSVNFQKITVNENNSTQFNEDDERARLGGFNIEGSTTGYASLLKDFNIRKRNGYLPFTVAHPLSSESSDQYPPDYEDLDEMNCPELTDSENDSEIYDEEEVHTPIAAKFVSGDNLLGETLKQVMDDQLDALKSQSGINITVKSVLKRISTDIASFDSYGDVLMTKEMFGKISKSVESLSVYMLSRDAGGMSGSIIGDLDSEHIGDYISFTNPHSPESLAGRYIHFDSTCFRADEHSPISDEPDDAISKDHKVNSESVFSRTIEEVEKIVNEAEAAESESSNVRKSQLFPEYLLNSGSTTYSFNSGESEMEFSASYISRSVGLETVDQPKLKGPLTNGGYVHRTKSYFEELLNKISPITANDGCNNSNVDPARTSRQSGTFEQRNIIFSGFQNLSASTNPESSEFSSYSSTDMPEILKHCCFSENSAAEPLIEKKTRENFSVSDHGDSCIDSEGQNDTIHIHSSQSDSRGGASREFVISEVENIAIGIPQSSASHRGNTNVSNDMITDIQEGTYVDIDFYSDSDSQISGISFEESIDEPSPEESAKISAGQDKAFNTVRANANNTFRSSRWKFPFSPNIKSLPGTIGRGYFDILGTGISSKSTCNTVSAVPSSSAS